jgi:thioredoxin reductase (NADPH)
MTEHGLQSVAYPKLDKEQTAALGRYPLTTLKRFRDGEKLFEAGERDFKFFVVKSGEVQIVDESGETPRTITVHEPGNFTGDMALLAGGPALVSAVARGDCEVYAASPAALRQILNLHPELGDIILQAFIARRQLLRESGDFTGLRVIGSRYSPDTLRIREFLAKNLMPYPWLDLEDDPQVDQLLKQFGVTDADTPVVAWGRKLLPLNPSNRALADALGIRPKLDHTVYDGSWSGPGRRVWRRPSTAPPKV